MNQLQNLHLPCLQNKAQIEDGEKEKWVKEMSDGSEFNEENYVSETGGLLREVWDIEQGSLTLLIN